MLQDLYPKYSAEYMHAWAAYASAGYRYEALSEQQLTALSSDLETKGYIDRWRRQKTYEAEKAAAESARMAPAQPVKAAKRAPDWTEKKFETAMERLRKSRDGRRCGRLGGVRQGASGTAGSARALGCFCDAALGQHERSE